MSDLEKQLVDAIIKDRKSDRRWRNIRFFIWLIIIVVVMVSLFFPKHGRLEQDVPYSYVSLVRLNGVIMPGSNFSAQTTIPLLQKAFMDKKAKGVILVINSPGGSPVQATIIHDKILQLKAKYHKKVVVVGMDALASGAYLIASAADKIYAQPDTLTGSIGVIMSSFGLTDAMHKLGITRRVYTAGKNKDRLDPFKPVTSSDKKKIKTILSITHQHFIDDVMQGRKAKLHGDLKELFSGDFWTGTQAVDLGLLDGTANTWVVMKKEFKVEHYRMISPKPTFLRILLNDVKTELNVPSALVTKQLKLAETLNND